jgi:aspartate/methionine/tyrosine aminotransferase
MFIKAAEDGADVLVICDDAYFGLFYEKNLYPESLFSLLCNAHERLLAVKIDGPIKEDCVWGLRTGFVTFGSKGLTPAQTDALVTKLTGSIRASVSCANTSAQHTVLRELTDSRTPGEKRDFAAMMQRRYEAVKAAVEPRKDHPVLHALPFNSGYFMCFICLGVDAEVLRKELLDKKGVGTVSLGSSCLRVAYSSLDEEKIDAVFKIIYDTAASLK